MWKRITSKSRLGIRRLLVPPTSRTLKDIHAPRGLTVRRLVHHAKYHKLREEYTVAESVDGHLLCISNLVKLGFDWVG